MATFLPSVLMEERMSCQETRIQVLYTNSKKCFIMINHACASDGVGAPPLDTTSCFAYI